jgi:hypothetical protein
MPSGEQLQQKNLYPNTSLARASNIDGNSIPSALAVFSPARTACSPSVQEFLEGLTFLAWPLLLHVGPVDFCDHLTRASNDRLLARTSTACLSSLRRFALA